MQLIIRSLTTPLHMMRTVLFLLALSFSLHAHAAGDHHEKMEQESNIYTVVKIDLEFDPFEGNYIDTYTITLDDGSKWIFPWHIYERNKLNFQRGDRLQLLRLEDGECLMAVLSEHPVVLLFHDDECVSVMPLFLSDETVS